MASMGMPVTAHKDSSKIQQLFESADPGAGAGVGAQLPDISLRPDSAARGGTSRPARSLSQSTNPINTSKLTLPLTPQQAIEKFRRTLTMFELEEIHEYPQVYFVGPLAKKIAGREDAGSNAGYDDDKGRYKLIKNDHIGYRYEVLKGLGRGSFGEVVRTYDHKTQQHYALKIIRNERRFHKQGQIEIKILEHLRKEDRRGQHNIIHFKEWFVFRNHICITFELLHIDLYSALKNDSFRGFAIAQVQHIAFSMLVCLRVLHKSHLIHCDLKPENILLCRKDSTDIKVIDFGSACFDTQRIHTYIQSRFYRSPEVILGANYGMPIDMWSLGCILVELVTGQPLFPGHDEKEQLLMQMEVLGLPTASLLEKSKRFSIFFDASCQPRITHDNKGRARVPASRSLAKVLGRSEPDFEDFVLGCLRWDPDQRLSPKEALRHPFVAAQVASSKVKRTASEGAAGGSTAIEEEGDAGDSASMQSTTRTLMAAVVPLGHASRNALISGAHIAAVPAHAATTSNVATVMTHASIESSSTLSGTSAATSMSMSMSMSTSLRAPVASRMLHPAPAGPSSTAAAGILPAIASAGQAQSLGSASSHMTTTTASSTANTANTAFTSAAAATAPAVRSLERVSSLPASAAGAPGPGLGYASLPLSATTVYPGPVAAGPRSSGGGGGGLGAARVSGVSGAVASIPVAATLPPPTASSGTDSSSSLLLQATAAAGPAAGPAGFGDPGIIVRKPSTARMTTDQQAHAERLRNTANVSLGGNPGSSGAGSIGGAGLIGGVASLPPTTALPSGLRRPSLPRVDK